MKVQKVLAAVAMSLALAGVSAKADIMITYADHGVGEWTPANEFNSDAGVLKGVQHSVDIWNGDAAEGVHTDGGDSATFSMGSGTEVPAVLGDPTAYVDRKENADALTGLDNSAGLYTYLTAKYGNSTQQVFYIGDIKDIITVPASLGTGAGLSHIAWLTGDPGRDVPDGGITAMLLGMALTGLGASRRFMKK